MSTFNLAQVNIARMLGPVNGHVMAGFVANLDRINLVAENSKGFVWRLKDGNYSVTSIEVFEDDFILVNMSVWTSKKTLFEFTYSSAHMDILKRKKEWFSKMEDMHIALWYVPEGVEPTHEDAKERLEYLKANGESPYAFTFKNEFSAEEADRYVP